MLRKASGGLGLQAVWQKWLTNLQSQRFTDTFAKLLAVRRKLTITTH
jgi:hypothetical protein